MASKRMRSKNFTEEEALQLISLAGRYKYIIENKQTNAITNTKKTAAWKAITAKFNSLMPMNIRSTDQLMAKYENLKQRARKYSLSNKESIYAADGGPSQDTSDVVLDAVLELVNRKSVYEEDSIFDDDFIQETTIVKAETLEIPTEECTVSPTVITAKNIVPFTPVFIPIEEIPETSSATETAHSGHHSKKEGELEEVLEAKGKFYAAKTKLMNLEIGRKQEELRHKTLQNDLLEHKLEWKRKTEPIRLALLNEKLERRILMNKKRQLEET